MASRTQAGDEKPPGSAALPGLSEDFRLVVDAVTD